MFGKQDPFCKVTIGDKTFQTRVHQDGGRNPKWDEAFVFRLPNPHMDQLTVQIEDSGMIANSIIGTCQLPVSIWTSGRAVEQWYPVNHGNKQRGEILLCVYMVAVSATLSSYANIVTEHPAERHEVAPTNAVDENFDLFLTVKGARCWLGQHVVDVTNPHCEVSVSGAGSIQSKKHVNGKRNPRWDEGFIFKATGSSTLQVWMFDATRHVSQTSCFQVSMWPIGKPIEQLLPLIHQGVESGELLVSIHLTRTGADAMRGERVQRQSQEDPSPLRHFEVSLRVVAAVDLFDSHLYHQRNLFCRIKLGDKVFKTHVLDNCGKNPIWDQVFMFHMTTSSQQPRVDFSDSVVVEIEDDNIMRSGVGTCAVPVNAWADGKITEQWYPVLRSGKQFGDLCLVAQVHEVQRGLQVRVLGARFDRDIVEPCVDLRMGSTSLISTQAASSHDPRDPTWNDAFLFKVPGGTKNQLLQLDVFDANGTFVGGKCILSVQDCVVGASNEARYPLVHEGNQVCGDICVALELIEFRTRPGDPIHATTLPAKIDKTVEHKTSRPPPPSSPVKSVHGRLLQAKNKGHDLFVAFAKADTDNDGVLTATEFRTAIDSFCCFTEPEVQEILRVLGAKDKTVSLRELRWLQDSAVESEWENMFFHPFENKPGSPEDSYRVQPARRQTTKPHAVRGETGATKQPRAKQPPVKDATADGIWMTEDQLVRILDAIPQFNKPSAADATRVAKRDPKQPVQRVDTQPNKTMAYRVQSAPLPLKYAKPVAEPPKTKTMFIREAIPLALKAMTETMEIAYQRGGDGENVGIWLTQDEFQHVVDAYLSATSSVEDGMPLASMPPMDICEELLDQSTKCHLCLALVAEFWCCECTTAMCHTCLKDVCCKQLRHQVEVYVPVGKLATGVDTKPMKTALQPTPLAEKQKSVVFLPLTVGPILVARLCNTRLHGQDTKSLKQLCMLLRKQIEMQPLSKVILGFLDRSCVSTWSADALRCFLDVIHVPSAKMIERQVTGDQFLRLSVPSLHDTFGIATSFALHRCLFYRALLSLVDQWCRMNAAPMSTALVTAKPEKLRKKIAKLKPPPQVMFSWDIPEPDKLPPPARKEPKLKKAPAQGQAKSQMSSAKPFTPVKKLHSESDEELVQAIQDGMKHVDIGSLLASTQPEPRSVAQMQRQVSDLAQRLEVARSQVSTEDSISKSIENANKVMQKLIFMTPHELESEYPILALQTLMRDIEDKIAKTSRKAVKSQQPSRNQMAATVPGLLREAKHTTTWTYQMPEPALTFRSTIAPGPGDYNTDNARAFRADPVQTRVTKKPAQEGHLVKAVLSDLGFDRPTGPTRSSAAGPSDEDGDPPPFDIAEFVADEMTSHSNVSKPNLYDASFLESKQPRSTWQALRAKYDTPASEELQNTMARLEAVNASLPKPKPKTRIVIAKPATSVAADDEAKPAVTLDWAKRIQANYAPL
ncbi:Aste57867_7978 [Aphanomyces stellatus]|uniref:Aste57867_7978 protein n=1 Tax=Aphanomyces stellatus TaxID=120398 RepID=A0A485KJ61_9STRA|nr:hypothetical protein As57867_007948 [Aphanomyces stellatus]VFT84871.1 Aste57867_7978 [Aphanomyces stellatus]